MTCCGPNDCPRAVEQTRDRAARQRELKRSEVRRQSMRIPVEERSGLEVGCGEGRESPLKAALRAIYEKYPNLDTKPQCAAHEWRFMMGGA